MTSVGREELSEVECFSGGVGSLRSAMASVGRRVAAAGRSCTGWLTSRTARLRDDVKRALEDTGLALEDGRCRTAAGRIVAAVRTAFSCCRRLVGRRLTAACAGFRPRTARLRQSLSFWRAVLAEFVGTFFLVIIGCGSATEQTSYSSVQQLQQDRAVRVALAFGTFSALDYLLYRKNVYVITSRNI